MITVEQAQRQLLDACQPISDSEPVALNQCLGRILAEPVIAALNSPPFDNSAMDGYAVISSDVPAHTQRSLTIGQMITAGSSGKRLHSGQAARILTGAPIPPGADSVVIQEDCQVVADQVLVGGPIRSGTNIRQAGEDIAAGNCVLNSGLRLGPQHIGLAATIGRDRLTVKRPLRIAILSTGDELQSPGRKLGPGQIYNSNQTTLNALLQNLGCKIIDYGLLADQPDLIEDTVKEAATCSDLIISSGGVSVGDRDYVRAAIEKQGKLDLWRIAIKPGKPMAFGRIGSTPCFGLPGNPVSLFVTFVLFIHPYLLRMLDCSDSLIKPVHAVANFNYRGPASRQEYLRARVQQGEDGMDYVTIFPHQGSAVMTSICWANCLAIIPAGSEISSGMTIEIIMLDQLLR